MVEPQLRQPAGDIPPLARQTGPAGRHTGTFKCIR